MSTLRGPRLLMPCLVFMTAAAVAQPSADNTPDAWLEKATHAAPPAGAERQTIHGRVAAVMARMGRADAAAAYLDQQYKGWPKDRVDGVFGSVVHYLTEPEDGPGTVQFFKILESRGHDILYACRNAVGRLIEHGRVADARAVAQLLAGRPARPVERPHEPREIQEINDAVSRAQSQLDDAPPPPKSGEHYYGVVAMLQARAGLTDKALASARKMPTAPHHARSRAIVYARIAQAIARQDKFDRGKAVAAIKFVEDMLQADPFSLHISEDDGRLIAMEVRARLGDKQGFERNLSSFVKRHANELTLNTPADELLLPTLVQCRLLLNDVAGAKAALEEFVPTFSTDPQRGFAVPARHFAAAGKLDDLRPWLETLRSPEHRADTYAHACIGVAEGLWDRSRRAAAPAAAAAGAGAGKGAAAAK